MALRPVPPRPDRCGARRPQSRERRRREGAGGQTPAPGPLLRPAAEALARLGQRPEFTERDGYVFCNRLGPSAIRRRYKRAAAAADLRPVKLHGLRHAAGSVLARSLPLVTVRDVLAHAKIETTNPVPPQQDQPGRDRGCERGVWG